MVRPLDQHGLPPALILLFCALLAGGASAAEERIGERLFLVRDKPGTPTQFQMIVNAGCADEAGGECRGLAHYLEHLVLVGRNPEHKDAAVRFFPDGYANGWTNLRATAYVHSVPARASGPSADLEQLFGFYAARLKDFSISPEEALRERTVVRQEHDWRVASRPFPRFARMLDRALLPDHPMGQWTVGTKEDIEVFTLDDAKALHRNWYAINNVYFVIRGDIEPAALKDIADHALAGLVPRRLPPRARLKEPQIIVERKDLREQDAQVRRAGLYVKKLFRMEEPDLAGNRAARQIVLNFLRSRLPGSPYDVIVDRGKLAAGQPFVALTRVAPKTFVLTVGADVAPDVEPEKLLAGVEGYVEALASNGVSAQTIARLQTRFAEARANADKDPAQVYARLIAWLAQGSRYEDLAAWPQRIAAVTPNDVATVLQGISGPGRIVTGVLAPATTEPKP
jgi:zinc protease